MASYTAGRRYLPRMALARPVLAEVLAAADGDPGTMREGVRLKVCEASRRLRCRWGSLPRCAILGLWFSICGAFGSVRAFPLGVAAEHLAFPTPAEDAARSGREQLGEGEESWEQRQPAFASGIGPGGVKAARKAGVPEEQLVRMSRLVQIGQVLKFMQKIGSGRTTSKTPSSGRKPVAPKGPAGQVLQGDPRRRLTRSCGVCSALLRSRSQAIEALMLDDFVGAQSKPHQEERRLSVRGWLEHRSHLQSYAGPIRQGWTLSTVVDLLNAGQPEQAKATALLAIAALDQSAIDSGNWLLAAEFSMESPQSFSSFQRPRQLDPLESRQTRISDHSAKRTWEVEAVSLHRRCRLEMAVEGAGLEYRPSNHASVSSWRSTTHALQHGGDVPSASGGIRAPPSNVRSDEDGEKTPSDAPVPAVAQHTVSGSGVRALLGCVSRGKSWSCSWRPDNSGVQLGHDDVLEEEGQAAPVMKTILSFSVRQAMKAALIVRVSRLMLVPTKIFSQANLFLDLMVRRLGNALLLGPAPELLHFCPPSSGHNSSNVFARQVLPFLLFPFHAALTSQRAGAFFCTGWPCCVAHAIAVSSASASRHSGVLWKSRGGTTAWNEAGPFSAKDLDLLSYAAPCNVLPVEPSRLNFVGTPSFDPVPFLDSRNRATYARPLDFARDIPDEEEVSKVSVRADRRQTAELLQLLDDTGRLHLFDNSEVRPRLQSGLFSVAKDSQRDRMVLDARPPNQAEQHTEDLKESYHSFIVGLRRAKRNVFALELSFDEVSHLKACSRAPGLRGYPKKSEDDGYGRLLSILDAVYAVQCHRVDVDLRALGSPFLITSDASSTAEAAAGVRIPEHLSVELCCHGLQRASGPDFSLRCKPTGERGELPEDQGMPDEVYTSHPLWEEVCSTLQFFQVERSALASSLFPDIDTSTCRSCVAPFRATWLPESGWLLVLHGGVITDEKRAAYRPAADSSEVPTLNKPQQEILPRGKGTEEIRESRGNLDGRAAVSVGERGRFAKDPKAAKGDSLTGWEHLSLQSGRELKTKPGIASRITRARRPPKELKRFADPDEAPPQGCLRNLGNWAVGDSLQDERAALWGKTADAGWLGEFRQLDLARCARCDPEESEKPLILEDGGEDLWDTLYQHPDLLVEGQRVSPACLDDVLSKWERLEPTQHRTPMPEPILWAMVSLGISWGWHRWSAVTFFCFLGCCRIGEVLGSVRRDLLTPCDLLQTDLRFYLVFREPKTRGRGARVQHVAVELEKAFADFLSSVWERLPSRELLFPGIPGIYKRRWDSILPPLKLQLDSNLLPAHSEGAPVSDAATEPVDSGILPSGSFCRVGSPEIASSLPRKRYFSFSSASTLVPMFPSALAATPSGLSFRCWPVSAGGASCCCAAGAKSTFDSSRMENGSARKQPRVNMTNMFTWVLQFISTLPPAREFLAAVQLVQKAPSTPDFSLRRMENGSARKQPRVNMFIPSSATDHRKEGIDVVRLSEPTSVPLRDAADLVTWTEDVCQVLAECVAEAMQRPVELECPGLWAPFPILRSWLSAHGFVCGQSGLRSLC
ncbi:unnamed protein product [Symbiodinium sp. CCMP2592]|nr:unnamed protein product [Symbiodinium sp. CCMP2592]